MTLQTGDIVNTGTYGPDFVPDWDGSGLADVISTQVAQRFAYTWRSDTSTFAPGRLDYFIYTDSGLELGNHYILYTPEMGAPELAAAGLLAGDVTTVADHIPHVVDFRQPAPTGTGGADSDHGLRILEIPSPTVAEVTFALELDHAARVHLQVFDVRGRVVADLGEPALTAGVHRFRWDGTQVDGAEAPAGIYIVRAASTAGESLAHKAVFLR